MDDLVYSYEIEAFGVHNTMNGCNNVIYEIRGNLVGTRVTEHGEGSYKQYFVVHLPIDNLEVFVEYKDVTKQIAEEWIRSNMTPSLLDSLKQSIYNQHFPKTKYLKPNF
jgi:hypothetical protein